MTNLEARLRLEPRAAAILAACRELTSSLDYEATLSNIGHFAVRLLADWCVVAVREGNRVRVVTVASDPSKQRLARELERCGPDMATPERVPRVFTGMQTCVVNDITDDMLDPKSGKLPAVATDDPRVLEILRALGMRSYVAVPLLARGEALGAILFVSAKSPRFYGPDEVALAEELGWRAAIAVDNARLYRDAQQAVRARDNFLALASHELRTPLMSLRLNVHSLRRGVSDGSAMSRMLDSADRQTARLTDLVDTLFDVARIESGHLSLDISAVDLAATVNEVAEMIARQQAAAAGSSLSVDAPAPVVGRWDRVRIERVVINLLSNAIKFGAGRPIEVRVARDGNDALLIVTDHGVGIPRDKQDRIFNLFERAVPDQSYGGLGIGLFIVKQVVTAHGGTVVVKSDEGRGCTFVVTLPCAGPCDGH